MEINRIYIYIHLDKKAYDDSITDDNFLGQYNNVKLYGHLYNCDRFVIDVVSAMHWLLEEAYKDGCDYYHFFSETCRLIVSLYRFKEFFMTNNGNTYMDIRMHPCDPPLLDNKPTYKGVQWMTLHHNIVDEIIKRKLCEYYIECLRNGRLKQQHSACDEVVFQVIVMLDICHYDPELENKYKIIRKSLRSIKFIPTSTHPRWTTYNDIDEWWINNIILDKDCLIIRKYDYTNENCQKFLKDIRNMKEEQP